MRSHFITGAGDVRLHVEDWGDPNSPAILFLHGFAQSASSWRRQLGGNLERRFRLVLMELRGHGQSDKPRTAAAYWRGETWATDINSVVDKLGLGQPVVVAWSYAGLVLCDFLRHCGARSLRGVVFVSARSKVGTTAARDMSGSLFLELAPGFVSEDAQERTAAIEAFVDELTYREIPRDDYYRMLGYNMVTPAFACRAMLKRVADNDDVLAKLKLPALVVHGDKDTSIKVAMAEHNASLMRNATLSIYPNVGHAPFYEVPRRFNRELSAFARRCFAT